MKAWLREHRFALVQAMRQSFKPRSGFLLNVLVIAIALSLPFSGLTLLENILPLSEQLSVEPEVSVFLGMDVPRDKAIALASKIRSVVQESGSAGKVEFVPREKALDALRTKNGLGDVLATLGSNPLPDGYVIKLAGFKDSATAAGLDKIVVQLNSVPGVEYVQVDSAWVKRLAAVLKVFRLALVALAAALGVVVVAVVFNTIRLQVLSQREEIEISRLVGASNAFIHRPFYYTGALLGSCAGLIGLGLVGLLLQGLNGAIVEVARLYGSDFRLLPLGLLESLTLVLASSALGLVGSLLSVQRHLARLTRTN